MRIRIFSILVFFSIPSPFSKITVLWKDVILFCIFWFRKNIWWNSLLLWARISISYYFNVAELCVFLSKAVESSTLIFLHLYPHYIFLLFWFFYSTS